MKQVQIEQRLVGDTAALALGQDAQIDLRLRMSGSGARPTCIADFISPTDPRTTRFPVINVRFTGAEGKLFLNNSFSFIVHAP